MMSLLKYFKKTKEGLPDPKGPLSTSIPLDAISLANQQVASYRLQHLERNTVHTIGIGSYIAFTNNSASIPNNYVYRY